MKTPAAYHAHDALIEPARAHAALWRLFAGVLVIGATAFLLSSIVGVVIATAVPREVTGGAEGQTPGSLLLILGSFLFLTIGTGVAARLLHHRGFASLLGRSGAVVQDFSRVLFALLVLSVVIAVLPPYEMGAPLTPNLSIGLWLALLPLSLLALLVQTSAEEILFRGYLQQQLAARFKSPLIWVGVPSALFAFGHYVPAQAGDNAVFVALWAGLFGVLMADLTARAGNLGPAIAVHFANNATALLLISLPDSLSGLALYTIDLDLSDRSAVAELLPVEFALMVVLWLTARLAIRR